MFNALPETIYNQLQKHRLLVQSYLQNEELYFIFYACRLKPHFFFEKTVDSTFTLQTWWVDEYGNSVKIIKNKTLKITYGDLSVNRNICSDLYYGLSINKVVKMSKFAYISYGQDEDFLQDCFLISLLGLDDYLRTYLYMYGELKQVSPLLLGLKNLSLIANNYDIKYYRDFIIKENSGLPCKSANVWLTSLPVADNLRQTLITQCPALTKTIGDIL